MAGYEPPARGGVNVGGGSSVGRALFAFVGGLGGAYYGFYLQSKFIEERRVRLGFWRPFSKKHGLT